MPLTPEERRSHRRNDRGAGWRNGSAHNFAKRLHRTRRKTDAQLHFQRRIARRSWELSNSTSHAGVRIALWSSGVNTKEDPSHHPEVCGCFLVPRSRDTRESATRSDAQVRATGAPRYRELRESGPRRARAVGVRRGASSRWIAGNASARLLSPRRLNTRGASPCAAANSFSPFFPEHDTAN
jgi:hypothetical protein